MIGATDPGATTGVAISSGVTPAFAKLEDPSVEQVGAILGWAKATAEARGEHLVWVVEDQYATIRMVRRGGKTVPNINFAAIKSLIRRAEVWAVLAEHLGIQLVRVMPETWQGPMLSTAPKKQGRVELSTKQRSQIVVRQTFEEAVRFDRVPGPDSKRVPSSKIPQDPCDAILMMKWYQDHGRNR